MAYNKVLIDTNICLDAALLRKPFASDALHIIELSEQGNIQALLAAHSFDTIYYLLRKRLKKNEIYQLLKEFRSVFEVAPITSKIIDEAIELHWADFEDAIHYQAAVHSGCEALITRNENDYKATSIPVLSPQKYLEQIQG